MLSTSALSPYDIEQLRSVLYDPVEYARVVLGGEMWPLQAEIAHSVASNPLTVVRACHSSGKTWCAAHIVLWALQAYEYCSVVTAAPTETQVKELLWGEIRAAAAQSAIAYPDPNTQDLHLGPRRFALGFSPNQPVRWQGFHNRYVLVVLDEASGIPRELHEGVEALRSSGEVHVLKIGNANEASGAFYEDFSDPRYHKFVISAYDTPNLQGLTLASLRRMSERELDDLPNPHLITRRYVLEMAEKYGEDSDVYRIRVLGEFPRSGGEDVLIPLAWIEQAQRAQVVSGGTWVAGLDVARYGNDRTVLTVRQGMRVVKTYAWSQADTMETCGKVDHYLSNIRPLLHSLNVDAIGLGAGVADRMEELGWPVAAVTVSGAPTDYDEIRFRNLRAQYYWHLRTLFQRGLVGGEISEEQKSELVDIRYRLRSDGSVELEEKEKAKERLGCSPDFADSIMLAFAPVTPATNRFARREGMQVRRGSGPMTLTERRALHARNVGAR